MQQDDPFLHAETDAFHAAGRRASWTDTVMVTTLPPCWCCSGLVRQFRIARRRSPRRSARPRRPARFATVSVGVLATQVFGLSFARAVVAVVVGNGLAAITDGVLSARGPAVGVPQMVLGRSASGHRGNVLPSVLMSLMAGFGWFAGAGLFVSCTVLMPAGAASVTIAGATSENPTQAFTSHLPSALAHVTLLAIALGAVCADVLNVCSGSMAFLAMGSSRLARNRAAVPVAFGVVGFLLAWAGLADAGEAYEDFLLLIAHWTAPWLGVVLVDQVARRGDDLQPVLHERSWSNPSGVVAVLAGLVVSVVLLADRAVHVGPVAKALPGLGDVTVVVGFLPAAGLAAVLPRLATPGAAAGVPTAD